MQRHYAHISDQYRRSGYLRREAGIMIKAQDEVAAMAPEEKPTSAFSLVETRSELARELTKVFKDVKNTGAVQISFNGYSEVLFCLPQKVHKAIIPPLFVEPDLLREMSRKVSLGHI